MRKVGLVGWRGMVGSVLFQRMLEENDFHAILPHFYTTSEVGSPGPRIHGIPYFLKDANDIQALAEMDIIITCQGSDYSRVFYPLLRDFGWKGYWIDAASVFRMKKDSCIILDPVNREQIDKALDDGIQLFVGGNCSVTLSLLGLSGLFKAGLIEWMSLMTYQSASGAGARHVRELIAQSSYMSQDSEVSNLLYRGSLISLLKRVNELMNHTEMPKKAFSVPLIGNVIPWIDNDLGDGNSREEWKGEVEAHKILGLRSGSFFLNGLCVRVGVIRCHSAAITMKLKYDMSEREFLDLIESANPWVRYVSNNKEESIRELTPARISNSLKIAVGRYKKMFSNSESIYSVFTVGDQLLWGAAEPLRRMLNILLGRL
ncbi:MAG: aspartate-semialdehyde dehydrogenase [Candidatus Tokpelaia sp. JSC161]|jgi:aspartate-semialdehyde dehydrogenase|nr:MAG: aspartate-semialdehyde dehydrogenase [Candidatus Tokpelaia sp. JSC161]